MLLLQKQLEEKLNLKNNDFRFCIELPLQIQLNNYLYTEIPIKERKRFSGIKKVNELRDGFLILLEIVNNFFNKK